MNSKSKKYHYVYRITNLIEKKHYYGKRTCHVKPQEDLGKKYLSSSTDKEFLKEQKEYPDRFKYKVITTFNTVGEAVAFEIKLHKKFNVGQNPNFYNRCIQSSEGYDTTGMITVKDKDGNCFNVSNNDTRYISGELVGNWYGIHHSEETKRKMSISKKKRYETLPHNTRGTMWIHNQKTKEQNMIKKELDIPVGWIKGKYKNPKSTKPKKERNIQKWKENLSNSMMGKNKGHTRNTGNKNPMYGKKYKWINNGNNMKKLFEDDILPCGFIFGMLK